MSLRTGEVLGRVERRRRFTAEEKLAVLAEASVSDVNISAVARRHGLTPSQVYKWRRLAELGVIAIPGASELPSFMAVHVASDEAASIATPRAPATLSAGVSRSNFDVGQAGLMEIDLGRGRRVRVARDVDADALHRVVEVLLRR